MKEALSHNIFGPTVQEPNVELNRIGCLLTCGGRAS